VSVIYRHQGTGGLSHMPDWQHETVCQEIPNTFRHKLKKDTFLHTLLNLNSFCDNPFLVTGSVSFVLQRCSYYIIVTHSNGSARVFLKATKQVNGKRPKFDPSPHPNRLTDLHKNWHA